MTMTQAAVLRVVRVFEYDVAAIGLIWRRVGPLARVGLANGELFLCWRVARGRANVRSSTP